MRIVSAVLIVLCLGVSGFAQPQSVFLEDLTSNEVQAAVTAGKTTAIFYASAIHRAPVALGRHAFMARHVAGRIAQELGNALVLPISPYAPANEGGDPSKKEGQMRFAGTLSLSDDTFSRLVSDTVTSAIVSAGFKTVVLLSDHGATEAPLASVAKKLDAEWRPKGTRVHHIPSYPEVNDGLIPGHLNKLKIPEKAHNAVADAAELLSLEQGQKWVRMDEIPAEFRKVTSADLGKTLSGFKVSTAVRMIRSVMSAN